MPALDPAPRPSSFAADLSLLVEAAHEAGRVASGFWRRDPEVWAKGDKSPVSEADLAVNDLLGEILRGARPDYGWLSEETPDDPARLEHERVFIVDPIDGTRAFVAGDKAWAHALAVAEGGTVIAAVVFLPLRDEIYTATQGGGAMRNGAPLRASTQTALSGATVLANKRALDAAYWPGGVPEFDRHSRAALAHRLALVGQGRFDASLSFSKVWEWDSAAGCRIVEEAGGRASDRTGRPLRFNQPDPRSAGLIASGATLHGEILARCAS